MFERRIIALLYEILFYKLF